MPRSTIFSPEREPLRSRLDLQLRNDRTGGPFSFLNPTQAHYDHIPTAKTSRASEKSDDGEARTDADQATKAQRSNVGFKWSSRNNRKGRHALTVRPADDKSSQVATPEPTNRPGHVLKTIWKMFVYYPVWDVSWWVAYVFTWGSIIWVINAFFSVLPYTNPTTDFPHETLDGGGITAFIGATVFELGSVLLMLEAVNENRTGCFGWAVEEAWDEHVEGNGWRVAPKYCTHHHPNKRNFVGGPNAPTDGDASKLQYDSAPRGARSWTWWPSWHDLKTHYLYDLGFLACCAQMAGATVFWISGFTALPGIYNNLAQPGVLNGVYWVPQIIGGSGFVISGTLFMIETQKHWWMPALNTLGWHIGFWNLIGGIGFTMCPIFGIGTAYWRGFEASLSTFWGE